MTTAVRGLTIALLLSFYAFGFHVSGQQQPPPVAEATYVQDEVIVQFRKEAPRGRRDAAIAAAGGQLKRRYDALAIERLQISAGRSVAETIAELQRHPDVMSAEPNFIREIVGPTDPKWLDGALWGLRKIQAETAWTIGTGSGNVVVANLDTGVNYNHPDLAANMWRNPREIPANGVDDDKNGYVDDVFGIDTANNDRDPMDDHGHGTHTAGTIGAVGNNGVGVVGVNWKVKIIACKFIGSNGTGADSDAIECFNYIVALKNAGVNVRVTSNSWGSARSSSYFPQALKNAIDAAGNAGIVNVFAAGNSGTNTDIAPHDPASFTSSHIVSVAASDSADNRASFSNYGVTSVDLAAPGVSILSTRGTGYSSSSGTSMAAPHVAGAAALLADLKPQLTPVGIKTVLMNSVDALAVWNGKVASGGRLNLLTATIDTSGDIAPTVTLTRPSTGSTFAGPANVILEASASDADGTVGKVDFYANGAIVGTDTAAPYAITWSNVQPGSYSLSAVATDNRMLTATSSYVDISVGNAAASTERVNVAAAANGAKLWVSSTYSNTYAASYAIDGNRRSSTWGNTWADKTPTADPDWILVEFSGAKTIQEIDVFTGQANGYVDPTLTMTSTNAIKDFQVQYLTGTTWSAIPGGTVVSNSQVWRQFVFSPVTTTAILVWITKSGGTLSRVAELEAYESSATPPPPPPPTGPRVNVAKAASGGQVSASSTYNSTYSPSKAIDGNRKATLWGNTWADQTSAVFPDWLQVNFNGSKTINEIDVFSGQGDGSVEPTSSLTSPNAITDFQVQYWTGSQWTTIPGGNVTGNQKVWKQFVFSPINTTRIRVLVTRSANPMTRIAELEAYQPDTTTEAPLIGFPNDNWWNLDISNAPVDPKSAAFISFINNGSVRRLHPDFGGNAPTFPRIYGMPYVVVDSTVPKKTVQFYYSTQSDGVDHQTNVSFPFYPIPDEVITQPRMIEIGYPGNVDLRGVMDRHLLIVDKDNRHLYELYNVYHDGTKWLAASGAFFDMNKNDRRPDGWTSADAAGLAILPGLVRYEEAFGDEEITHAFRVTVRATNGYVFPASHRAGSTVGALPMGARLRLKASKDLSSFPPELQRIFRAMKRYGLIVADNGTDMFITGGYDPRWSNDILNPAFRALTASDFEVITLGYK